VLNNAGKNGGVLIFENGFSRRDGLDFRLKKNLLSF